MTTIGETVEWIIKNRRGRAFRGYSPFKILSCISECVDKETMVCISDPSGIVGVCCGEIRDNTLYIHDILTIRSGIVKQMLSHFLKRFPGYTLEGMVGDRKRKFTNPQKLFRRL